MSRLETIELVYLFCAVCFIVALKGLSSPRWARQGNLVGAVGMVVAIATTFAWPGLHRIWLIVLGIVIGTAVAIPAARTGADVTATDLTPELLARGEELADAEGLSLRWRTADAESAGRVAREIGVLGLSGPPTISGMGRGGGGRPTQLLAVEPFLVDRTLVDAQVRVEVEDL